VDEIRFVVPGLPPLKNEAKSLLAEGHPQAARVRALLEAVYRAVGPNFVPFTGPVGLQVLVEAPEGATVGDASNMLGGIGDTLQAARSPLVPLDHLGHLAHVAIYRDDGQITEIRYRRRLGSEIRYGVRVRLLERRRGMRA